MNTICNKAIVNFKSGKKLEFVLNEIIEDELLLIVGKRYLYRFVLECDEQRAVSGPIWTLEKIYHMFTDHICNQIDGVFFTLIELIAYSKTEIENAKWWIDYHTITTTPYKLATNEIIDFQYREKEFLPTKEFMENIYKFSFKNINKNQQEN